MGAIFVESKSTKYHRSPGQRRLTAHERQSSAPAMTICRLLRRLPWYGGILLCKRFFNYWRNNSSEIRNGRMRS